VRVRKRFLLVFAVILVPTCQALAASSWYLMNSDCGDPIGQGYSYYYSGPISLGTTFFPALTFGVNGWDFDFAAPNGQLITKGGYLSASGYTFGPNNSSVPQVNVTYFESYDIMAADFTVEVATYDANTNLVSFLATFDLYTGDGVSTNPAGLHGQIGYNATLPITFAIPASVTITQGAPLSMIVTAMEYASAPFTVTAQGLPNGASFTNIHTYLASGMALSLLSWTPSVNQIGNYLITFTGANPLYTNSTLIPIAVLPATNETSLRWNSEDGDPVGQGGQAFLTPDNSSFSAPFDNCSDVVVEVSPNDGSEMYWMKFANPGEGRLAPGVYTTGLEVAREEDCNYSSGTFQINQIVFGYSGDVVVFGATFEQRCNGDTPALFGDLRYNAAPPVNLQAPLTNFVVVTRTMTFTVTATDVNSNIDTLTATGLPDGATFQDNGDNTGTFQWTPDTTDVGDFFITFHAENAAGESDTATTKLSVALPALTLYSVQKDKVFFQKDTGLARQIRGSRCFGFDTFFDLPTNGTASSGTLQLPTGETQSLSLDANGRQFNFSQSFTNQSSLDAAYPGGTYDLTVDAAQGSGLVTLTLDLATNAFPNPPHVNNWTAAQDINASQPFILTWDAFVGGGTDDLVQAVIWGDTARTNLVFLTPNFNQAGGLEGTATAALIPPGVLQPGRQYFGELLFGRVTQKDAASYPLALGFTGYLSITGYDLKTMSALRKGAGSVKFSAPNYIVNNNVGAATISVTRAGGNSLPITADYATADGTAHAGIDYRTVSGSLVFSNGLTSQAFTIPIIAGTTNNSPKTVLLLLGKPGHRATHKATLHILEN
jgi:hypothetical protein